MTKLIRLGACALMCVGGSLCATTKPFVPDNWEAAKVFPVTADVLRGERTLTVAPDGLSPQQALETIRAAKKGGDTSAWTVDVKPGFYPLREPLTFTPEDSGTAAAPVTWRGAGEASEISGGAPLVGWRDTGKGWFETDAPTGPDGIIADAQVDGRGDNGHIDAA